MSFPPSIQDEYAEPIAKWQDAFSSNKVLKKTIFVSDIGDLNGTKATSPK